MVDPIASMRRIGRRMVLGGLLLAAVAAAGAPPTDVVELREAWRTLPGAREQALTLPDTARLGADGQRVQLVRYRLEFERPAGLTGQALYLPGLMSHARLSVNGQTVLNQLDRAGSQAPWSIDAIRLVAVPDQAWRAGRNEIELVAGGLRQVSVSSLWLGPEAALAHRYQRKVLLAVVGPLLVSTAIGCLALCVLLLWVRARSEPMYGYFGLGALGWALHSAWSVSPVALLPGVHNGIWWTAMYGVFVTLLAVFALRFARWHWPRFERALWVLVVASPAMLFAAHAVGQVGTAASAFRLGLVGVAFVGLAAVAQSARRRRGVDSVLFIATGLASAGLGLRDWLVSHLGVDNHPVYLTPYAGLLFIALVAWMLIDRFVQASREVERMNAELEARVAAKSAELLQALEATRHARDAAEQANRAKSTFLAAASHDLRQPIHALGLYLDALCASTLDPRSRDLVQRMVRSVGALQTMFDALLDISRMDAGAIAVQPRAWSPAEMLHRLADEAGVGAADKGLRLQVRLDRHAQDWAALTDPILLERVLRNLLGNAVKYTDRGGVLLSGRLRQLGPAVVWRFQVWDTGRGVPPEELERIFDEFYQVGQPPRGGMAGMGLGLSIVRRLVRLLDLPLTVRSQPGRGSTFGVDVPATQEQPAPVAIEPVPALQGLRVAVLEDDIGVRDGMRLLLQQWGCEVSEGRDAAELLAQQHHSDAPSPQAIVADYQLGPHATGVSEVERLRAVAGRSLPALIVTADAAPERLQQIQTSGLPWLIKPLAAARLRSWLQSVAAVHPPIDPMPEITP